MVDNGEDKPPRCFMAMPITTRPEEATLYDDDEHWHHIRQTLFETAIRAAGYEPVVPEAKGAYLIHERIVRHLEECELVLCDLSADNPNVFFELGVRTSLDKPIALVWDGLTKLPFDTGGINTHKYDPKMTPWRLAQEQEALKQHILDSAESCGGRNPLWRQFGLTMRAQQPSTDETPLEAKVDLLLTRLDEPRQEPTNDLINRWYLASQASPSGFLTSDLIRPNAVNATAHDLSAWARSLGLRAEMRSFRQANGEDAVVMRLIDPIADTTKWDLLRGQISRVAGRHGVTVHVEYHSTDTREGTYDMVILGGKRTQRLLDNEMRHYNHAVSEHEDGRRREEAGQSEDQG